MDDKPERTWRARAPGSPLLRDETPEGRQAAVAELRQMSRDDRLALLMRSFADDCGALRLKPRRAPCASPPEPATPVRRPPRKKP